jgi:hypothetical protein
MSLVIAFIGAHMAVMAGDQREIRFRGDPAAEEQLEEELYNGILVTDDALQARARELGVYLEIQDTKQKIQEEDGILIGEVTSSEGGIVQKRRLYATAGRYAIVEIKNDHCTVTRTGTGSNFVVMGNPITQSIAHQSIREHWKNGTVSDAIRVLIETMETASRLTASVSHQFLILQTSTRGDLSRILK